jgi:hypothetical protein
VKPTVKIVPIADLLLDENNANLGTKRGRQALDESLKKYGAGRSILVDKNFTTMAGNKTLEGAKKEGFERVVVVDTDGKTLVAVRRTDLLASSKKGRELAIADNRIAELDLRWDDEVLAALQADDMSWLFTPSEIEDLIDGNQGMGAGLFTKEQIVAQIMKDWPKFPDAAAVVARVITLAMAMGQFNSIASGGNTGYYISALFNPQRLDVDMPKKNKAGYVTASNSNKHSMQSVGAKFLARFYDGDIHPDDFVKYAGRGWGGGGQLVYEFRPSLARDLYLRFCKKGATVLDPCHGWGGRAIGWLAANLGGRYIGFDPATKTNAGVKRLIAFLQSSKTKSRAEVYCLPFECSDLTPKSFDFALTSPPYFDTENYSDESTNSQNKFPKLDDWVKGFYRPLIEKTVIALKPGAHFIMNVGNKLYPLADRAVEICKDLGVPCKPLEGYKIGKADGKEEDTEDNFESFIDICRAK